MSHDKDKLLEWQSFPLVERPIASIFVVGFFIFLVFFLWEITVVQWEMPIFYVLGILFFFIELIPYFIPTKYEFYEDEIVVTYFFIKIRKQYDKYKCFYADKRGILLGTFNHPHRLDRFRGLSIRFSKDKKEKEKLIEILKEKVGKQY